MKKSRTKSEANPFCSTRRIGLLGLRNICGLGVVLALGAQAVQPHIAETASLKTLVHSAALQLWEVHDEEGTISGRPECVSGGRSPCGGAGHKLQRSSLPSVSGAGGNAQGTKSNQTIAFLGVNVITMASSQILTNQTVLVQGDRIAQIGPASLLMVPEGARRIEAAGQYLMPGLTDTHVHLEAWLGARPEFGDAPLFLASGVTTVFNLRGHAEQLDWRKRIQNGEILAPNLYTAGEFIDEPRVKTPEEVEAEVARQARDGYDILKLHPIAARGCLLSITIPGILLGLIFTFGSYRLEDSAIWLGEDTLIFAMSALGIICLLAGIALVWLTVKIWIEGQASLTIFLLPIRSITGSFGFSSRAGLSPTGDVAEHPTGNPGDRKCNPECTYIRDDHSGVPGIGMSRRTGRS
jgi:hypothetical protein